MEERTPDNHAPDTGPTMLTARDAAVTLGVNERTIRRAILRGTLPATKRAGVWQVNRADLNLIRKPAARHAPPPLIALPHTPAGPRFDVPQLRTPIFGREREIERLETLIMTERAPLVTLTGPGGSGKTRLALAVAERLRDQFADGIWFVDLSPHRQAHLVPGAIAHAMNLREVPGEHPLDRLRGFLQARTALLVLDNLEHIEGVATGIAQLLTGCGGLQVLATSRIPLHVSMEHQIRVAPLGLPPSDSLPRREQVEAAPATQLFRHKARMVRRDFQLTDENAPAVAAICAHLDGLPLAIELAAAQSAVYSPETLLLRLGNRLAVLDRGPPDAPLRLRSMRDAIGWSDDLLDDALSQRFRRLSVFAGGFTADAATLVTSHQITDAEVPSDQLAALVDANLLVADPEASRFTMLETIREFGLEQLAEHGEEPTVRDAHATWCHTLLVDARPNWFTPSQGQWSDLLDLEHANLRAALSWLTARERTDRLVVAAGLMWPFWFVRHHWAEGVAWLEQALNWSEGQRTLERVRVLIGAGCLWMMLGDEPNSRRFNEEALAISQDLDGITSNDSPLNGLAICANVRGDFAEGTRLNNEALAMLRSEGDTVPSALPMASVILCNMAWNLFLRGDITEAEPLAHEALDMQRMLQFDWAAADTLYLHAHIAEAKGEPDRATGFYRESLRMAVETRDLQLVVHNLDRSARYLSAAGHHERVALLLGASARLHEIVGDFPNDERQTELTHITEQTHAQVGANRFDSLRQSGAAMPLTGIMAIGLEATVPPTERSGASNATRLGITQREHEVLCHLAQGLTDQEIAGTLFIGRRTVHTHVSRLLAKLEAANRRGAVVRARSERLLDDCPAPGDLSSS